MLVFPIKIVLIVAAFMLAYWLRWTVIRPKILEPVCLINSDKCVQLEYFRKDNSALVTVYPSAYRVWFNGSTFYVYLLQSTGRTCDDPEYQPAYEVKPTRNVVQNYQCIRSIPNVLKYYEGVQPQRVRFRVPDPSNFSVYDVIQYLIAKRIVGLE
jgi:hypothetical protein